MKVFITLRTSGTLQTLGTLAHFKYFSSLFHFGGDKVSTGLVEASVACRGSEALVKPGQQQLQMNIMNQCSLQWLPSVALLA